MALQEMPEDEDYGELGDVLPDLVEEEEADAVADDESADDGHDDGHEDGADEGEEEEVGEQDDSETAQLDAVQLEPGDEEYGKKVKKRIARAIYERNKERDERIAAQRRSEELERKLRDREASDQVAAHTSKLDKANSEREAIYAELQSAYAEADLDLVPDITARLSRKDAEIVAMETRPPVERRPEREQVGEASSDNKRNPAAQAWIDGNSWFDDPKHARARSLAIEIEATLREEEGFELGPKLYAELDKRLLSAAPKVAHLRGNKAAHEDADDEQPKKQVKPKARSVVSGQNSGDSVMPAQPSKGKLTQEDLKTMKKYGMDPNSAVDRKAWLNRNAQL